MTFLILLTSTIFLLSLIGMGVIFQTSLAKLPFNYKVPYIKQNKLNIVEIQKEFNAFFPKVGESNTVAEKKQSSKEFINIPRNIKVIAYVEGKPSGLILKINRETLIIIQGETVKGWKLLKITNNFAILNYKGLEVKIPLHQSKKKRSSTQINYSTLKSNNIYTISREEVNRLTQNYGSLLTQVDFVPYIVNGQTKGFKLRWVSTKSIFYKIGFRPGDVILSVNGMQLKNTEDVFRVLQILRNEPSLRVKVLRNGKTMEFYIQIS